MKTAAIVVFLACQTLPEISLAATAAQQSETPPSWTKMPSSEDLRAAWPKKGLGKQGFVYLRCVVTINGALSGCSVASEEPVGDGFGTAALLLTPSFIFRPATRDGAPIASEVTIPINFSSPPPADADASDGIPNTPVKVAMWFPWVHAPTATDIEAHYPPAAKNRDVEGHVVVRCRFNTAARLERCATLTEEPQSLGFGRQAVKLTNLFQGEAGVLNKSELEDTYINLAIDFAPPSRWSKTRYVNQPDWTQHVDESKPPHIFPRAAVAAKITKGHAIVDCAIGDTGRLENCRATSESPAGLGFGAAAIATASALSVNLWTRDGSPTSGAHIQLPIALVDDEPKPVATH